MEFQHRLMRATVSGLGERAVLSIQNGSRRGIRSLAGFSARFAKRPAQKVFFRMVRHMAASPSSLYNDLIRDAVCHINPRVLITASVNFGYNALAYGTKKHGGRGQGAGSAVPWNLIYDLRDFGQESVSTCCALLDRLTGEGRDLGIYAYMVCTDPNGSCFPVVMDLALKYADCIFFVGVEPESIREPVLEALREVPNVIPFVHVSPLHPERADKAFALLYERKRLFGYLAVCGAKNGEAALSRPFLERMIRSHCLLGVYITAAGPRGGCRPTVRKLRAAGHVPLLCFDFIRDMHTMANMLQSSPALVCFQTDGRVMIKSPANSGWILPGLSAGDGALLDVLRAAVPVASGPGR